jgi:hypothetical protein
MCNEPKYTKDSGLKISFEISNTNKCREKKKDTKDSGLRISFKISNTTNMCNEQKYTKDSGLKISFEISKYGRMDALSGLPHSQTLLLLQLLNQFPLERCKGVQLRDCS